MTPMDVPRYVRAIRETRVEEDWVSLTVGPTDPSKDLPEAGGTHTIWSKSMPTDPYSRLAVLTAKTLLS